MKKSLCVILFLLLMGCTSIKIKGIENTSKLLYTIDEYNHIPKSKRRKDEISIKKYDLIHLKDKGFRVDKFDRLKPLILNKEYHNILDVLNDKKFREQYVIDNLEIVLYYENRMIVIECTSDSGGSGCSKDLLTLNKKELDRQSLGMVSGCLSNINIFDEAVQENFKFPIGVK